MAILPRTYLPSTAGYTSLLNQLYRQYNPYAAMGQAALAPINTYIQQLFRQDQLQQQSDLQMRNQLALEQARNADIFQRSKDLQTNAGQRFAAGLGPYLSQFQAGPSQDFSVPSAPAEANPPDIPGLSALPQYQAQGATYGAGNLPPYMTQETPAPNYPPGDTGFGNVSLPGRPAAQTPQEAFLRLSPTEQKGALGSFFQGGETTRKFATENILDPGALARQRVQLGVEKTALDMLKEKTELETTIATQPGSVAATNATNQLKQVEAEMTYRALTDPAFATQMTDIQKIKTGAAKPSELNSQKLPTDESTLHDLARANLTKNGNLTPSAGDVAAEVERLRNARTQSQTNIRIEAQDNPNRRFKGSEGKYWYDPNGMRPVTPDSPAEAKEQGYIRVDDVNMRSGVQFAPVLAAKLKPVIDAAKYLPQATGNAWTDQANAKLNGFDLKLYEKSNPQIAQYNLGRTNAITLLRTEGGGARNAWPEMQQIMDQLNSPWETDASFYGKMELALGGIIAQYRRMGASPPADLLDSYNTVHQGVLDVEKRIGTPGPQGGGGGFFSNFSNWLTGSGGGSSQGGDFTTVKGQRVKVIKRYPDGSMDVQDPNNPGRTGRVLP